MRAHFEKIAPSTQESFACRPIKGPFFDAPWHFHPEYELILVTKSRGTRFVGDNIEAFSEGDLVLLGPNLPHVWQSDPLPNAPEDRAQCIVVQFLDDFLGKGFFERPEMEAVRNLFKRSMRGLRFTGKTQTVIARRMHELVNNTGCARIAELLHIFDLLARSDEYTALSSAGFVPSLNRTDEQRINLVCQYITEHFTESIQQPKVAALINMSSPAFSRFFHNKTGKTFSAFVNELRVGKVCRMLIEGGASITEICYSCGFKNLSNFNRQFRMLKGISPREYRKKFREPTADKRPQAPRFVSPSESHS